jgi:hypothetical protein
VYSHVLYAIVHRSQSLSFHPILCTSSTPWIRIISPFVLRFHLSCHDYLYFSFPRNIFLRSTLFLFYSSPNPGRLHLRSISVSPAPHILSNNTIRREHAFSRRFIPLLCDFHRVLTDTSPMPTLLFFLTCSSSTSIQSSLLLTDGRPGKALGLPLFVCPFHLPHFASSTLGLISIALFLNKLCSRSCIHGLSITAATH